jgi:hypothetical protein
MTYERYLQTTRPSPLESAIRAGTTLQRSAARERPRSLRDFENRAIALAAMDAHMAASCLSSLPAGRKDGRMKYAPSIGLVMAEVIGATYGTLRVESFIVEETSRHVRARGLARDIGDDFGASSDVVEPLDAVREPLRHDGVPSRIAGIATAKARREAIFLLTPRILCEAVDAACRRVAFGNPDAYAKSLERIAAWMNTSGIREERVWRALGVSGESALNIERAATLMGLCNAIDDRDTTPDEAFPRDSTPPKFIPQRDGAPSPAGGEPRESAPCAATQLARLMNACRIAPESILEYIGAQGQGTYRSIAAAPEAILACVVRAWPDVIAELAQNRGE